MTESAKTETRVDKNVIDGSRVMRRETARIFTPLSKYPGGLSPTYGVDFCKLEDGREVFQCVHPDPPECEYWHLNGTSVRAHLRVHTLHTEKEKLAALRAAHDKLVAKEAQRTQNYRNGAAKTVETRKAKANEAAALKKAGTEMDAKKYAEELSAAQTAVENIAEGVDKVTTILANIVKSLDNTSENLGKLAAAKVDTVDPALKAKADSWDAIQGLLNPNNKR